METFHERSSKIWWDLDALLQTEQSQPQCRELTYGVQKSHWLAYFHRRVQKDIPLTQDTPPFQLWHKPVPTYIQHTRCLTNRIYWICLYVWMGGWAGSHPMDRNYHATSTVSQLWLHKITIIYIRIYPSCHFGVRDPGPGPYFSKSFWKIMVLSNTFWKYHIYDIYIWHIFIYYIYYIYMIDIYIYIYVWYMILYTIWHIYIYIYTFILMILYTYMLHDIYIYICSFCLYIYNIHLSIYIYMFFRSVWYIILCYIHIYIHNITQSH